MRSEPSSFCCGSFFIGGRVCAFVFVGATICKFGTANDDDGVVEVEEEEKFERPSHS